MHRFDIGNVQTNFLITAIFIGNSVDKLWLTYLNHNF